MSDPEIIEIRKMTPSDHTKPWGDTLAFAHAILNTRKEIGWVILDKNKNVYDFVPARKEFYGTMIDNNRPSVDYLKRVDQDWAGLAPHTVKEVYTD